MTNSKKKAEILKDLYVVDPFNGRAFNMMPFFKALQNNSFAEPGSMLNLIRPLQSVHDYISTRINLNENDNARGQFEDLKDSIYHIVMVRKMFEEIAEG
jgi:hypothetical protein